MSEAAGPPEGFVRLRIAPALWTIVTFVAGLSGRFLVPKGFFSKYSGDVLYTTLIYVLVLVARPRTRPWHAALFATGLSFCHRGLPADGHPRVAVGEATSSCG
ncbi:MAG: hypothetical protein U0359_41715 [Byssovorax sp.]